MAHNLCLHPDLIKEVMEDLFASDIVNQHQLNKLKSDIPHIDHNLIMDVRHKEVKKESLIDIANEKKKREKQDTSKRTSPKVKDLKTVDKEISNTRKHLEAFQNQLEKKNESLINTILDLEKERENLSSPAVVQLNEQETAHYFNLHLDDLENAIQMNQQKDKLKTWKPIEDKESPIINVTTTIKDFRLKNMSSENNKNELKLLELSHLNPFHITGKSLDASLSIFKGDEKISNLVPSNSPEINVRTSVFTCGKNELLLKEKAIVQKVLKTWKFYVRKKKTQKYYEEKKNKVTIDLLKHFFSLWVSYVKYCKTMKKINVIMPLNEKTRINPTLEINKFHKSGLNEEQQHSQISGIPPLNKNCEHQQSTIKPDVKTKGNKDHSTSKDKIEQNVNSKNILNKSEKCIVHVKTLTPQDVGLIQPNSVEESHACKKQLRNVLNIVNNGVVITAPQEPLLNRFEAQEKIIQHQKYVIEKQSRTILDLQAKYLEVESKLNLTLVEKQLAELEGQGTKTHASFYNKNKPTKQTELTHSKASSSGDLESKGCHNIKIKDKSGKLVKDMLERQAYCSQLAEQAKMRKKRIEEEKERTKLEQEEKQKQEKKEERKKTILKMKMEQLVAYEKEQKAIARKLKETELTEKAIRHYNNTLLHKSFAALKTVSSDVLILSEECNQIYRKKLMRKMFNHWKDEVKQILLSKNQLADNHYYEKLIKLFWNNLLKLHQEHKIILQVSEDMYALKLQERIFHRWQAFTAQQFLQNCYKIELAERLYRKHLLIHCFRHWKELPKLMYVEREKEQRRRSWRFTVQQLIPDFTPFLTDDI